MPTDKQRLDFLISELIITGSGIAANLARYTRWRTGRIFCRDSGNILDRPAIDDAMKAEAKTEARKETEGGDGK